MTKVLVTGGHGLVGSAIQNLIKDKTIEFVFLSRKECDLRNLTECKTFFAKGKFDIVIHLANVVGGLYKNMSNNYSILIDNTNMNTNILECCRTYNIKRLINCLSTCVFGNDLKYPLTSNQMYDKNPDCSNEGYSVSKRLLDTGSKLLSKYNNIEIVNLIPTNLYGFGDNWNLHDSHVIPGLIEKTHLANKKCGNLIIKGTGEAKRQFVFADDLGRIILHFVNCELDKHFNQLIVGPPIKDEITIKQLVNKITTIFDFKEPVIYDIDYSDGQLKKTVDSSELLKYIPNFKFTSLDDGLKQTIEHFLTNYNTLRH